MRKISKLATILITSLVMILSGLVASPIATASENETVQVSATFPLGSSVLTKAQKAEIKKALLSSGSDVSFMVTGIAGKFPGVSDRRVQALAKKRAQAIKAYLLSLGVSETRVTTEAKITKIGIAPKIENIYLKPAPNSTPTATAVATNSSPAAPAPTCATGATCVVGDRGPGGGIVYYVSAANFTSAGSACGTACKYLEVAPATWRSGSLADDATYKWSDNTTVATTQVLSAASPTESGFTDGATPPVLIEQQNWKIGQGFNNTRIMKVTGATSLAQAAVLAYAGNSTAGQWFIPSMNELNELCKYAWGQTTGGLTVKCNNLTGTLKTGTANDLGGFVGGGIYSADYWSSSESVFDNASAIEQAWSISFNDGSQTSYYKAYWPPNYVRPIRAF